MKNHLKHLQKTFFSPPRTKNDNVNDIKEQTLLQNQQKSNPKRKNLFRSRTEQWNDQKDFLFHQKSHKNQNFARKSFNKQKKNILLNEQSLKRATFTHFSNENQIKNEPFAKKYVLQKATWAKARVNESDRHRARVERRLRVNDTEKVRDWNETEIKTRQTTDRAFEWEEAEDFRAYERRRKTLGLMRGGESLRGFWDYERRWKILRAGDWESRKHMESF